MPLTPQDMVRAGLAASHPKEFIDVTFRAYRGRIQRLCRSLLRSEAEAEDACTEVFEKAMKAIHTLDNESCLSTWLYRIATNCCLDKLRRARRKKRNPFSEFDEDIVCTDPGEEAWITGLEVNRMLNLLEPHLRDAIVLVELDRLSAQEAADVLKITRGALRARLYRGRLSFKTICLEQYSEHE